MAARCASLGACENAGDAIMKVTVASDAQIVAARVDVSIIFPNPQSLALEAAASAEVKSLNV
jgi:hypothetical protein